MLHCLTNERRRKSGRHPLTVTPSGYAPATDTSIYDALGQRVAVQQTEQLGTTVSSTTRVFSYDGDGQILSRRDGTVSGGVFTALSGSTTANPDAAAPQHYVYAEGHRVASLSEAGLLQTSDGLTPYSDPQSSSSYTVQAGDTLSIAGRRRNGVRFTYCGARGVRGGCQDATHPAKGRMTKPTAAVAAPTADDMTMCSMPRAPKRMPETRIA